LRRAASLWLVLWLAFVSGCSESESSATQGAGAGGFTPAQLELLRSLSLASLGKVPEQPSNEVAADRRAARLGRHLFFDTGLSRDGTVACATCHIPALYFTDGKVVSTGLGRTSRNSPTVVAAAYSPWQFWDGRRDSLWAQALAPLEASDEMGHERLGVVRYVTQHPRYREEYRALFGPLPEFGAAEFPDRASPHGDAAARQAWFRLPKERQEQIDRAFSNVGKAIAAYERVLVPGRARFDRYVEALLAGDPEGAMRWLSEDEIAGLRLFVDSARTQCLRCHNGPLFTNQSFHHVATSRNSPLPDLGRFLGIQSLLLDPFNCLGPYSDAPPESCQELRFLARREVARERGAFKTPGLREVARTAPYFHDGSVKDLAGVMEHYRNPPPAANSELVPLELDDRELSQLVAFLDSLSGGVEQPGWLDGPDPEAL
jgi:cytochrome c peroxidase